MNTRHLIDPDIAGLVDRLSLVDLTDDDLTRARVLNAVDPRLFDQSLVPTAGEVTRRDGSGSTRYLLFDPPSRPHNSPAMLHLHGGGMVFGSAEMSRIAMPSLALHHQMPIISVDYRLAPETRFPGQIEDAATILEWMVENHQKLDIDPASIFVMGESAGGGLAAGLAIMLRDTAGPALAGQILTYPMLDHRTGSDSDPYDHGNAGEFVWTRQNNIFGWRALAGDLAEDDPRISWFSPSLADDLSNLPPAFIAVGDLDLFAAENIAYVARLLAAGVPTEFHVYPSAIHGFDLLRKSALACRYRTDLDHAIERVAGPGQAMPSETSGGLK